jgi:hypothetical protein
MSRIDSRVHCNLYLTALAQSSPTPRARSHLLAWRALPHLIWTPSLSVHDCVLSKVGASREVGRLARKNLPPLGAQQ